MSRRPSRRVWAGVACALAALAALAAATAVSGLSPGAAGAVAPAALPADAIDRMTQVCVEQMISNTCRAAAPGAAPPPTGAVFVAGIGAIDAVAYAELRSQGEAMCQVATRACRSAPGSSTCLTARQLWAAADDAAPVNRP